MSRKHHRVLDALLSGPVSGNIHWREIESLLRHLGARIEPGHGARMRISLNGVEGTLHVPHHSGVCDKNDLRHLRDYLATAGVNMASMK
ncbi:MAG: type II toxin-antitoxin system HicA family toxin [Gammaproteobacteria bacterium]|nr:type II toxin-antitoxin system HicA family toxin [Gammaproteobacteria bacterium]MDH5652733.1 type II toxin-antitoxin system HicA family toxin [Gammaproteobacteria bacterium]